MFNIYEQSNTIELGSSLPELKNNIRFYDFLNAITSNIRCHSTLPNSHPAPFSSSVLQAQGSATSKPDSPNIFFGKFCSGRILFYFPSYIKADSDITSSNSGHETHEDIHLINCTHLQRAFYNGLTQTTDIHSLIL